MVDLKYVCWREYRWLLLTALLNFPKGVYFLTLQRLHEEAQTNIYHAWMLLVLFTVKYARQTFFSISAVRIYQYEEASL